MANNRIFYASHAVALACNAGNLRTLQGGQSISMSTNYNLDSIFQLGRLAVYDNVSTDPEVTVTVTKALDGYPLIFSLATKAIGGSISQSIIGASNAITSLVIGVGADTDPVVDDAAAGYTSISLSGLFFESLTYTFGSEGPFTEEVSFKGSNKLIGGTIDGPLQSSPNAGSLMRRQNIKLSTSKFPAEVNASGISNITISTSVNREKLFTMGSYAARTRTVTFPIEITTTFDMVAKNISQSLATTFSAQTMQGECAGPSGLRGKQHIRIELCNASGLVEYTFDLGSGNTLQNHGYSGGDASGGNVTETFEYLSYNELIIQDNVTNNEPVNAGRSHATHFASDNSIFGPGAAGITA